MERRRKKIPGIKSEGYVPDIKRALSVAIDDAMAKTDTLTTTLRKAFLIDLWILIIQKLVYGTKWLLAFIIFPGVVKLIHGIRYVMTKIKMFFLYALFIVPLMALLGCIAVFFIDIFSPINKTLYGTGVIWRIVSICHELGKRSALLAITGALVGFCSCIVVVGSMVRAFRILMEGRRRDELNKLIRKTSYASELVMPEDKSKKTRQVSNPLPDKKKETGLSRVMGEVLTGKGQ